jgi:hypothetical protein
MRRKLSGGIRGLARQWGAPMNGPGKAMKGLSLFLLVLTVLVACTRKPEELPLSAENANRSDVLISHLREQWNGDLYAILPHRRIIAYRSAEKIIGGKNLERKEPR